MPDLSEQQMLDAIDAIPGIDGPLTAPGVIGALRALDAMQKDLFANTIFDGSTERLDQVGDDGLASVARHADASRAGKGRLVPVDRVIAALHVYSARMTFSVIPEVWQEQLISLAVSFVEVQVGRFLAKRLLSKSSFLGAVTDMFQGAFALGEKERIMGVMLNHVESEGQRLLDPFRPKGTHDLSTVIVIPQLSRAGFLRHPPSHGAPGIGLDGKVRGRPRKVRDVQTRHKFPVKSKRWKKTHWA